MKELAKKYYKSLSMLNQRIKELSVRKDSEISRCRRLHQDPNCDITVIDLEDRLKPLILMRNELSEVAKEVNHYYDRWWWRNERITCNQRKSRQFIYAGPT